MSTTATTTTTDPRVIRSRAQVLQAAARVFLEHGFQTTTVDDVATAAQVAKRTIYNLYVDKEALFRATVLSAIGIADGFAASLAQEVRSVSDPRRELPGIGMELAEATLLGPAPALRRLIVMESNRFPDLADEYRRRAPEAVMDALADLFEHLADRDLLRVPDPRLAAEHFAFLVMGADLDRGMFGPQVLLPDEVTTRAREGAEVFLRAYAP